MKQIGITSDGQGLIVEISHKEAGLIGEGLRQIGILVANIMAGLPFMSSVAPTQPENAPGDTDSATGGATAARKEQTRVKTQVKTKAPATTPQTVKQPKTSKDQPKKSWKAILVPLMAGRGVMTVAEVVAAVAKAEGIEADASMIQRVGQCLAAKTNRDAFERVGTGKYKVMPAVGEPENKPDQNAACSTVPSDPASLSDEALHTRLKLAARNNRNDEAARLEYIKRKSGGSK